MWASLYCESRGRGILGLDFPGLFSQVEFNYYKVDHNYYKKVTIWR